MTSFISSFPEIQWPALPNPQSAGLLAMLFELEQTQWWPAEKLAAHQQRQCANIFRHACNSVPFYRERREAHGLTGLDASRYEAWQTWPLLTRRDIQTAGDRLHSNQVPRTHVQVRTTTTSGSTSQPVNTLTTGVTEFFWKALTLRDHFWHRRDFSSSFAAIRYTGDNQALPPSGRHDDNWGVATAGTIRTGPAYLLNIQSSVEEQAAWLRHVDPAYLISYPSILTALAHLFRKQGWTLPRLRELRSFGEILEPACRAECQQTFGLKIVDMYSSQEVGYIALQCPEHEQYHLQSESLLVEILNDSGRPCRAGEIGRVVITTLHNFAMPLLRYDIGDYAEVGEPCPCGRGLPVVKRILGRQRNLLIMPDGSRRWPLFGEGSRPEELPPAFQFRVIQQGRNEIDVLIVRPIVYTDDQEAIVRRYFQETLGYPFQITLRYVEEIPRSRTGKFEDFVCNVSAP